jgi:LDH2 family malate/lactate/ureidoglycolate dehydrogenase
MPAADARTVAALMAEADLQGSDGHGVIRLPQYVKRIRAGGVNLHPEIQVIRERAGMALLHGDNGMGHLVMKRAAELAIEKARDAGVAWVGAQWSNHAGRPRSTRRWRSPHDMIGLYFAVGNANHLPPWGGIDLLLSTNPIAAAIPAGEEPPIVLDMATTVTAYGKVKAKAQRGELMPEGWMIDRDGRPLTDPKRANEGFLLPIGGYKGYGLALVVGLIAGTLNGAAMGKDVIDFNADAASPTNTGQAIVAIDPGGLRRARGIHAIGGHAHSRPARERAHAGRGSHPRAGRAQPRDRGAAARLGYRHRPALMQTLDRLAEELEIAPLRTN